MKSRRRDKTTIMSAILLTGENELEIYLEPLPRPANAGLPVPTVPIPQQPVPLPPQASKHDQAPNLRGSGLPFGRLGFPAHGGLPRPPVGKFPLRVPNDKCWRGISSLVEILHILIV